MVAIVVPAAAAVAIELLVGWVLVFSGIVILVDAFSRRGFARIAFRILLGAATLAAGIYMLAVPLVGVFTLTVMLVIWFVAIGFLELATGIAEWGSPGAVPMAVTGVLSLVLGFLISNDLPESAAWAIGLLVGVNLVSYGLTVIMTWFTLRRRDRGGEEEGEAATAGA